tara:strand:- start:50 stop:220 length:171 start_codon:yes stop_codon:yes gene_type:complete
MRRGFARFEQHSEAFFQSVHPVVEHWLISQIFDLVDRMGHSGFIPAKRAADLRKAH